MKKFFPLLVIVILLVTAGCFNTPHTQSKHMGIEKVKTLINIEKRLKTIVQNGIYVTGTTTLLYTFTEFLELSPDEQDALYSNSKAYLVYKDKYIDLVTFYSDPTVTATSFLLGTNGVKPLVDESVIPSAIVTKAGTPSTSGTEAFRPTIITLSSIAVTTQPSKTTYNIGEALDITGIIVTGTYSNNTTKQEAVSTSNITGFSSATAGSKTLTVTINSKTATFTITVLPAAVTLNSIAVTTQPTKTTYNIGEALDITGIVVTGTYSDNSSKLEAVSTSNITGFSSATAGAKTLTVTINSKTATFTITVLPAAVTLNSITVTAQPTKTTYNIGEALDITGIVVTGTYSDNSSKLEAVSTSNITGFDSSTAGTKTLTITINSKTATFTITVNPPVVIGFQYVGKTYSGKTTQGTSSPTTYTDNNIKVTEPTTRYFDADGYFRLVGSNTYTGDLQYSLLRVTKDTTSETTSYWLSGNFDKRIWLRFGEGTYKVEVLKTQITAYNTINVPYDGDINGWSYWTPAIYTFNINNTRVEDGKFYYPSDYIQSDDSTLTNKANELTTGKTTTGDKIKAIHDWVVTYLYYDDDSLVAGKRKRQDAISAYSYKTGVCEGYTSLMGALLRSQGIKCKAVAGTGVTNSGSGGHAWINVFYNDTWKLIDPTWDDPSPNDNKPTNLYYTYYMLDSLTGIKNDHIPNDERVARSITPTIKGYPMGIY